MHSLARTRLSLLSAAALLAWTHAASAAYIQTDLVSNIAGLASITDPKLVNPWGVAESGTGPFWVSDQGTSDSTLYAVTNGTTVSQVNIPPNGFVAIPTTASGPQGPTGQVFSSSTTAFPVGNGGNGAPARFIFADLNGTISAWNGGATAFVQPTTAGAVYTGLAINAAQTRLYAANGAGAGSINVFDSTFTPVALPGAFVDPNLPAGDVPFNVRDINGTVYVTYAQAGRSNQIAATAGSGVVAKFDENGVFLGELVRGSQLAAPWGIALAPTTFGQFGGDLLIANFSFADSAINAYDPNTGAFLGSIPFSAGPGNTPGGLWALQFGNGGSGGDPNTLYVTDGINGETAGLFAALSVPEPSSFALLSVGLLALRARRRRARTG